MIKAVTFDFWDTLVVDDSDEPVRAARGLPSKTQARAAAFVDMVRAARPGLTEAAAAAALAEANAWFRQRWKVEHDTPTVAERLDVGLRALSMERPADFDAAVATWEQLEVDIPPRLADGCAEMLAAVSERFAVGIISDAIVTPGRGLRQILGGYGLLEHFVPPAMIFSDEAGGAKPAPIVFEKAAAAFGLAPADLAHVGDREPNDIAGPLGAGWKSVLYTGAIDRRDGGDTRASAVCEHHRDMARILQEL